MRGFGNLLSQPENLDTDEKDPELRSIEILLSIDEIESWIGFLAIVKRELSSPGARFGHAHVHFRDKVKVWKRSDLDVIFTLVPEG